MILVPLTGVLSVLAIAFLSLSGYYGMRLSALPNQVKVTMLTRNASNSLFRGIILLAFSQIVNLVVTYSATGYSNILGIFSSVLLLGSALTFAIGFEKMHAAYVSERIRANVYNTLEELDTIDIESERSSDRRKGFR